jgi:hypothetical protein
MRLPVNVGVEIAQPSDEMSPSKLRFVFLSLTGTPLDRVVYQKDALNLIRQWVSKSV